MDFRDLVWKRVWKITSFGLKSDQDLKNRAAHLLLPVIQNNLLLKGIIKYLSLCSKSGLSHLQELV